jgi:hypothetical protein
MRDRQGGRRPYRGRRPSAARVRFLELLDSGMRPLEASREVGVNERTGRDWAKGIVKSKNRRYIFDGVLLWEAPDRPKPRREERLNAMPAVTTSLRSLAGRFFAVMA